MKPETVVNAANLVFGECEQGACCPVAWIGVRDDRVETVVPSTQLHVHEDALISSAHSWR